jgi:PPM family protein phosphatase
MTLALHYALRSDVGLLREGNEDSAYAGPRLLAIADGMGGHAAGEVASAVAISAIAPLDEQDFADSADMMDALSEAVGSARTTLHEMSVADPAVEGMGTTLTALLWAGAEVAVCHIGDSRAYLLRDGDLYQITRDHTLIQSLVDEGRISAAAAATHPQRSLIMRALQGSTDADPDLTMHEALLGDRYLLCSDGLTDVVDDETLHETLSTVGDADQAVRQLIALAIRNGGPDNITCIVADVVDTVAGPVAPSREHVLAGAAANGDARSLLRHIRPGQSSAQQPAGAPVAPGARSNGAHARAASDGEDAAAAVSLPRRRWPVITSILVVMFLLVAGGVVVGWQVVRGLYYVNSDGNQIIIYRGISQNIAGLTLNSVYKRTGIPKAEVPSYISLPTTPGSLSKARQTVQLIQHTYTCSQDMQKVAAYDAAQRAAQSHRQSAAKGRRRTPHPAATPKPSPAPTVPASCQGSG